MGTTKHKVLILGYIADELKARLTARFGSIDWYNLHDLETSPDLANSINVVFSFNSAMNKTLFDRLPKVDWVQGLTSGIDLLKKATVDRPDVTMASARGMHGPQMAEMAMFQMFMLARNGSELVHNQQNRVWVRKDPPVLFGKTVLIVGVGTVGRALASRCQAFGMNVMGVVSALREEPGFDRLFTQAQLQEALGLANFTVVLTPYSAKSHALFNEESIGWMRPDGYLINLSRGEVVSEDALIKALDAKQIKGAGLDVFDQEPLPPEHPYWSTPGVFITPHLGGMSDIYAEQLMPILEHNVNAYLRGDFQGMKNLIQTQGVVYANE